MDTLGAGAFGAIIGWYLYYVNRYRKGDVQLSDITTIIGAIGGGAILKLFTGTDATFGTKVFGAYGIGLAVGFFGYFVTLIVFVELSRKSTLQNFDWDWFLDGRRKNPAAGWGYGQDAQGTVRPMAVPPQSLAPATTQQFFIHTPSDRAPLVPAIVAASAPIDPKAQQVIDTCVAVWPAKKNACNFFAIEVANRLGVSISGTADDIVDQIRGGDWTALADGPAARDAASQGKFVLAGLKSSEFATAHSEGHVAVIVAGPMNPGGWAPAGYWGSTDPVVASKGGAGSPISLCFRQEDSTAITYSFRNI